jgi:hypothetical protein
MDWSPLESIFGKAEKKSPQAITFQKHRQLNVMMDGYSVSGGDVDECFISFVVGPDQFLVYSEMVCTPDEMGSLIRYLASIGADITAVHNHWLQTVPNLMYIHWKMLGHPLQIAQAVAPVWQAL